MARTPHISGLDLAVLYPDKYLKASHLQGHTPTIVIEAVTQELVPMQGGKKSLATIVAMKGKNKLWICNKTNGHAIAVLLGSTKVSDWIGKRIVLTADLDENKTTRQDEPCLRVLGSPDATKEQADAYARCWRGDRRRGALCTKLKLAVQRMLVGQKVAAVEPDEPLSDEPGGSPAAAPEDDWSDADPGAPPDHDPSTGEVPMRQSGDDTDNI